MARAWMTIGIAARMAICSSLSGHEVRKAANSADLSRCCWSIFILDRIHGSSFRILPAISDETILPETPPCAARPETSVAIANAAHDLGDPATPEEKDDGINSYALQLLSIWGRLMSYLKTIRQGSLEDAWIANSSYQQIKAEMSRLETVFPEAHRFKNARFHDRTTEELTRNRDYWAPWVFAQCIYHTIHCTLNHPFLHVATIHGRQRLRSPSFLQHTVDQAILHSASVVYLVDLCEKNGFQIFDPFVGHLVAIIATAQFFLQFSKDSPLAARAFRDFEKLRQFVGHMADDHGHLVHTVRSSHVLDMRARD